MMREARDATFDTSDGSAIAFTLHGLPRTGAPRLVLVHSLALDRAVTFTAELFARDLAELLDHVGWENAAIGGCSMGGCVAMAFAGLFPARASGLGLIDTTAWPTTSTRRWRVTCAKPFRTPRS